MVSEANQPPTTRDKDVDEGEGQQRQQHHPATELLPLRSAKELLQVGRQVPGLAEGDDKGCYLQDALDSAPEEAREGEEQHCSAQEDI